MCFRTLFSSHQSTRWFKTQRQLQRCGQLTQRGPRGHHALELRLDHWGRCLQLCDGVVDEELHGNLIQHREYPLVLRRVLAILWRPRDFVHRHGRIRVLLAGKKKKKINWGVKYKTMQTQTRRTGNRLTYVFEELLRQLLDMIHDFVRTGLLLSYPLHVIGHQLGWTRQRGNAHLRLPAWSLLLRRSTTLTATRPERLSPESKNNEPVVS